MPLLKLNSSKINYQYSIGTDNFIISEVVNSTCSYESPIVIRDKQTLDLYFGQNYPGRGYHNELISSGVSLLLQRPISDIERNVVEDSSNFIFNLDKLRGENNKNVKNYLCFSEFPEVGEEYVIYKDSYTEEEFIFIPGLDYINIKTLPQNLYSEDKYESWYNRDTLRLCSNRRFSLAEKYNLNKNSEFYFPEFTEELPEIIIQNSTSENSDSLEFYNHLKNDIKLYTSDNFSDYIVLIRDGNNIPNSTIFDLYPEENKYYHITVYLDNEGSDSGEVIKDLLWMEKQSLVELVNSKSKTKKIKKCGEIKLVHIIKEVKGVFENNPIIACNPRYKTDYPNNLYNSGISLVQHFNENPEYFDDLLNSERTLSFDLKFSKELIQEDPKEVFLYTKLIDGIEKVYSRYIEIPIPGKSERPFLISLGKETELGLDIVKSEDLERISLSDNEESISWEQVLDKIKEILLKRNYEILSSNPYNITFYSKLGTIPSTGFSSVGGIEIIPNFALTQDILSLETEPLKRIEFYSKTIGPNDDNIKIKIEKVNYYRSRYRITISRFSYSETYDLNLFDTPDRDGDIESMDEIINRRSRLVRCKLFREKSDGTLWKESHDPEKTDWELPTGEWELKRSIKEKVTGPEMYWAAIKQLSEFEVKEDFLCIPEIERFLWNNSDKYKEMGYFTEYLDILEYCKSKNCQALIGNIDYYFRENYPGLNEEPVERTIYRKKSPDNPDRWLYQQIFWDGEYRDINLTENSPISSWKNTFVYNYPRDYDNYLVYFFRDMRIFGKYQRPAYYLFLRGILGGQYSVSIGDISYIPPFSNAYIEEADEKILEKRKTNFLVSNNLNYFYKNYQNHPGDGIYNTTILTKFALSKVSRTIENNKWSFLGKKTVGEIKEEINMVLIKLKTTYNIYNSILLSDVSFNPSEHSMIIRLSVYIRELVDKPISLDIELNYIY